MANLTQHIDLIKQANKITNRKTLYAAGAGLIPIPIVDTITLLGVQLTMIQSIGNLYGIPFKKHLVKSLIGSLVGSISSVGLIKLVPGLGTVLGGATAAAAGAAATYALGRVFTQHFDQGGTLLDFDPISSREYFHQEYEEGRLFVAQYDKLEQGSVQQNQKAQEASTVVTGINKTTNTKALLLAETADLHQQLIKLQQAIDTLQDQGANQADQGQSSIDSTAVASNQEETTNIKTDDAPSTDSQANTAVNQIADFTIIEGIGRRIDGLLKKEGIYTMDNLSKSPLSRLQRILKDAEGNLNFVDPSTWAEQASLAAAGKMQELEALKKKLIGGKYKK